MNDGLTKSTAVLLAVTVALTSCSFAGQRASISLEGTAWRVDTYAGTRPIVGTEIRLSFDGGRVQGSAGCNSFGGAYVLTGNQLRVSDLMRTLMACPNPPGVMDQEGAFVELLGQVDQAEAIGDMLVLTALDGRSIVLFAAD